MSKGKHTVQLIFTYLPPAVLSLLYGLWLFMSPPKYLESAIFGGVAVLLCIIGYVRLLPACASLLQRRNQESLPRLCRTHRSDVRELLRALVTLVGARCLLFVLIYGISLYQKGYGEGFFIAQRIWANHIDAPRYLSIVRGGVTTLLERRYVNLMYPPFYSWVVTLMSPLASNANRAAFMVANVNTVLSGAVLYQLVLKEGNRAAALRALRYFCLLPPTFLLSCTLPFSCFMLFSLLALYAMRRRQFILSAGMVSLAGLSLYTGFVLLLPLTLELISTNPRIRWQKGSKRQRARLITEGLALLLPLLFAGLPLLINKLVSGDAWAYFHYRQELFSQQAAGLFEGAASLTDRVLDSFLAMDTPALLGQWLPGICALPIAFGLLYYGQKRLPVSFSAYSLGYLLVLLSFTNRPNIPLLLFCCPGLLISLVEISKKPWADTLMTLLSMALLLAGLWGYSLGWVQ